MRSTTINQHMTEQRRVRFNNVVTVTEVPSRHVYTQDQRFALWYNKCEYQCFRLQEDIRKLKTNNKELSDRIRDTRNRSQQVHKRKYKSKCIIGEKHKSAKISITARDALAKAIEARIQTNRRLAQIEWQMQQHYQQIPNFTPAWSFNSPTPNVSKPVFQLKQGMGLTNIPFGFSNQPVPGSIPRNSTPMNSPVARGA